MDSQSQWFIIMSLDKAKAEIPYRVVASKALNRSYSDVKLHLKNLTRDRRLGIQHMVKPDNSDLESYSLFLQSEPGQSKATLEKDAAFFNDLYKDSLCDDLKFQVEERIKWHARMVLEWAKQSREDYLPYKFGRWPVCRDKTGPFQPHDDIEVMCRGDFI